MILILSENYYTIKTKLMVEDVGQPHAKTSDLESLDIKQLSLYEAQGHSQKDQDKILRQIFKVLNIENGFFIEFGFNLYDYIDGSNTHLLYENGWTGLLLDGYHDNPTINLHKEWICANNIIDLFDKYDCPTEIDYISIDVDRNDFFVLESILKSDYKVKLFTIEYNIHYNPYSYLVTLDNCNEAFVGCAMYSGSFSAIKLLANKYGYDIIACSTGLDLFLLKREFINKYNIRTIEPHETFDNMRGHRLCNVSQVLDKIINYKVFTQSHDINLSRRLAMLELDQTRVINDFN